jgi:hypothetical protein
MPLSRPEISWSPGPGLEMVNYHQAVAKKEDQQ